jgi:hypothetical protein
MASDQMVSWAYEGMAQLNDFIVDGIKMQNVVKLTFIELGAQGAPAGADLEITLTKNTVPTTAVATLTDGSRSESTNIADQVFDTTDAIGFKITQIGSTFAGEGITITLHFEKVV